MLDERILIVDDYKPTCSAWRRMLTAKGSDVTVAHNLTDARAALKTERFDVVLLDIELGYEWGLDLLYVTDVMSPRPAVVIASGYINDKVAVQCMGRCAVTLPKPIEPKTLLECLDNLRKSRARSTPLAPCVTNLSRAADTIPDELAQGCQRYRFSPREIQVIRAGAEGLSLKETAVRLSCRTTTVSGYRRRACKKAGCRSMTEVMAVLLSVFRARPK